MNGTDYSKLTVFSAIFDDRINDLRNKVNEQWRIEAEAKGADVLINLAITVEPTVPIEEGTLRGSHLVGIEKGSTFAAFTMPYAGVHETNENFKHKEPGAGAHFVGSKLNNPAIFGTIAKVLESKINGNG